MSLKKNKSGSLSKMQKQDNLAFFVLSIPCIIWTLIFCYGPMFGIVIAFKNFNYAKGIFGSEWVGLKNFEFIFKSNDAFVIFRNTILYNFLFIFAGLVVGLTVAIMWTLIKNKTALKSMQTMMFLPFFISWVVVGYMMSPALSYDKGILNNLREMMGLARVQWYMEPKYWPLILLIVSTWKGMGYGSIVYYGSIISIDSSVYEAAWIDGCSEWKRITKIILPLLKPTIVIMLILSVGGILSSDFGLFYYIPNDQGLLYSTTDVIDTYLYRAMRVTGDMSTSSAIGLFRSVVTLILVMSANKLAQKFDPTYRVF